MWPFRKQITEIEAIDNELERLHNIFGHGTKEANWYLFERIKLLEDTLNNIACKKMGLEY